MSTVSSLNTLKTILFEEESKRLEQLNEKLKDVDTRLEDIINNQDISEEELQEILAYMMEVMPEKLGPAITATLKTQIAESRDEVVQVLFPIIGQMIKKFIQREMQILTEKIDEQLQNAFSLDNLMLRLKSMFTGVSYAELMIKNSNKPEVMEVFIIEEGSGILLGSYSRFSTMDKDMIAGMLTAIKSFVNDAFEGKEQKLEMVEYDLYKIYIQHFQKFYMAIVLSGSIGAEYKSKLDDNILKFVKDHTLASAGLEEGVYKEISGELEKQFSA